jgi:hypothetical protein
MLLVKCSTLQLSFFSSNYNCHFACKFCYQCTNICYVLIGLLEEFLLEPS